MKNKLFVLFAVVLVISAALAVSASAFTIADTGTIIKNKIASATQIPEMVAVFEKQATLGYIPTDTKIVFVGYDTDVGYMRALGVRGDYSAVTATASGSYATYTASSNILSVYAWTESGWIHENDTNRKVQVQNKIFYSAIAVPAATFPAINGYNLSYAGNADIGAVSVNAYYTQLCDIVLNYEDDIEAAEQNGYEKGLDDGYDAGYAAGYQVGSDDEHDSAYSSGFLDGKEEGFTQGYNQGKIDCEKTHLTLQEQAYDDGYDMGQEECEKTHDTIRQTGYDNGLYDCQQTHETLMRGQYEEGWSAGHAVGVNDGYESGYEDGYEKGDYDGFIRGFDDGMLESEKLTDEWLQKKYQQGFVDGEQSVLETSKVVTDYVDSLFSAPLNFLYTMLDVEVFGINVFGIAAAVVALAVVLVVVKIILKVKG